MTEPVIVADSSPLIALARIGKLEILPHLASEVLVPPAVWHEITGAREDAPGAAEVRALPWLQIREPQAARIETLTILLDRGEAEALALAQDLPGALVLVDDSRARRVAERLRVRRIGTVGLLRRAKKAGLLPALRPLFDSLARHGIYIQKALVDAVLEDVGEASPEDAPPASS